MSSRRGRRKKSRRANAAAERAAASFGNAIRAFFADHKTKRGTRGAAAWRGDAPLLGLAWPNNSDPTKDEPEVVPGSLAANWAERPVSEIDGHDIYTVVDDARRNGIPGLDRHNPGVSEARGRKLHAALSVLFFCPLQHRKVGAQSLYRRMASGRAARPRTGTERGGDQVLLARGRKTSRPLRPGRAAIAADRRAAERSHPGAPRRVVGRRFNMDHSEYADEEPPTPSRTANAVGENHYRLRR